MRTTILPAAVILALAPLMSGCANKPVDVKASLQLTEVVSGWYDAGIVDGQNKLVPSISFRLKNVSREPIDSVLVMVSFRQVNDMEKEWGSATAKAVDARGLAPGAVTDALVLRSSLGYKAPQARLDMLRNKYFVDANVRVFAKHAADAWVKLADTQVSRQLLTRY
jgi:hypothetical protein